MLHHVLDPLLAIDPNRPILECDGSWATAAELDRLAARLASGLAAMGLEEGDRVALLLPNSLELVVCYLACFRMRFVVVPIDYQYQSLQIGYAVAHSGASVLVVDHPRLAGLEDAAVLNPATRIVVVGGPPGEVRHRTFESALGAERAPTVAAPDGGCPAMMIYTSGTISRPKGVVLSHDALSTGVRKYLSRVTLTAEDVALISSFISRPFALRCQLLPTLWSGGRVSLLRQNTVAHYVDALRRSPAKTFLTLTPAGLGELMASLDFQACDFSALRLCLAGGDRVPAKLLEAFERLTGVPITEQCGSTETGPYAMNPPFGRKKRGSVGLPSPGLHVAVVDESGADVPAGVTGDILVSGRSTMDGYWNESAMTRKTLRQGWIRTGDLGRFDEDGYLWFMGRRKDIIVCGGNKIAPVEVEATLVECPAVREACVIGVPDPRLGEVPQAYVVLQSGSAAAPEDLRAFVASRLAAFMVPVEVHVIAKMPSKGPGKIDRELLRMRAITAALIEQVPFFRNASSEFLRDLIPRLDARTFAPGEVLVHEGDVGDEMYFLTRGQVEVLRGLPPERLTVLTPGSFFGELAILKDAPRAATVRALTDVEVYALRRDGVVELARQHADFDGYLQAAARRYESGLEPADG